VHGEDNESWGARLASGYSSGCQDKEDVSSCIGDDPCNKNVPDSNIH